MDGTFYCGYEINKIVKMKIQLPPGTSFGGLNCCYLKRCMFIYKCKQQLTGFALRRANWFELTDNFPEMTRSVKKELIKQYDNEIR